MSDLEMKHFPEDDEGDGSVSPGSAQVPTAEVCTIAETKVAESQLNYAASAFSNDPDISGVSSSGKEGAGSHTESKSKNGVQPVIRTLSAGSHSGGKWHTDG
ncbi:hypothetical protein QFC20_003718 [Naganishia adeliensis]|uniref:Uncharacterized protein n=1 Tax=Naganishia adeliensis TaxID=92952 RepID=A0ACC2W8K8_9TREE|nr:hypothetical protein QFC20_003718 [Naganishia adeliensis]